MLFLFLIGFPKGLLWRSNEIQHMVRRCVCMLSCLVVFDSVWPNGLQPARVLCPWGFSRQEYWSGLPCPSPGDLPNPEIESRSPTLQEDSLPTEPPRKSVVKYQTSCHSDTRSEDGGKTLSLCPGWLRQRLVDRNLHAGSKWTQQRRYKAWREIGWGPKTRQAGGGECSSSSARWSSQEIQPSLICARGSESSITIGDNDSNFLLAKDIRSSPSHQTVLSSGCFQASPQVMSSLQAPLQWGPNLHLIWTSLSWATGLLWDAIYLQKHTYCGSWKWYRDWWLLPSSLPTFPPSPPPPPVFPNPGTC